MDANVLDGRYRIDARLGAGGMGSVYEAVDLRFGRRVALKVLHAHLGNTENLERFKHEARVVAAIGHPGIASVFDFREGKPTYIVMERLYGETLATFVRRGTPEPGRVASIAMQALSVLAATHRADVVH